ncbi:DUF2637 domain-containing protein [Herbidospora sp. NEAU-GS84]|uniref:DUF2637 domain-containing protein n=1 Tax=Herbidospora solisilvae TaxID=2696284 RepID=A0A7C9JSP8_9ACTN|nr:DUF2637 domain-containing protein [Herbidospora solisilvae]NAS21979.1 DUF2637 domain-containing protein [Herbidospora solisilvae]
MTQTFYDSRAERTMAEAAADQARAAAEATRAETALRLDQARRQADDDRAARADRAREARRKDKADQRELRRIRRAEVKAQRRQARRDSAVLLAATVVQRAPLMVGGVAMSAPILIAWNGQLAFAREVMHLGVLAPALPIALEGAAWYLAYLTHTAIKAHLPAGRYRAWTWGLAGVAAGMNAWHGIADNATPGNPWAGVQVGIVLALASLLGILLWELTASQHKRQQDQDRNGSTAAEIRRAAWRRLRYPRLSWAAASIQAARAGHDAEAAWVAAWVDRYGIGPHASRRDRRLARKIADFNARADREAAESGRLAIIDGAIVERPSPSIVIDVEQIDSPSIDTPPSIEGDRSISVRSIEPVVDHRPKPSTNRTSTRTPRRSIDGHRAELARLIQAGAIEARPDAEPIRKALRCAPKTAATLRDELRNANSARNSARAPREAITDPQSSEG